MNLIQRAKNILTTPKTEWDVVATESATMGSLLTSYVIPMALIPTAATFLRGLIWTSIFVGSRYYIYAAIISFVSAIVSYIVTTYVVDLLATNFKSEKDTNRSAQLVAYSSTASWVAGILTIIPVLGWLAAIAGWGYSVYLMYLGMGPIKKTPEDQRIVYVIIIIVVMIVVGLIIGGILGAIFFAGTISGAFMGR